MFSRRTVFVFGLVFAGVLSGSPAQAAKGVREPSAAEHEIHGTIVHLNPNGSGTITVHSRGSKKKQGTTAVNAKKTSHNREHKLAIDSRTAVAFGANGKLTPATLESLHTGEHATVLAKNRRDGLVEIHRHAPKKKAN